MTRPGFFLSLLFSIILEGSEKKGRKRNKSQTYRKEEIKVSLLSDGDFLHRKSCKIFKKVIRNKKLSSAWLQILTSRWDDQVYFSILANEYLEIQQIQSWQDQKHQVLKNIILKSIYQTFMRNKIQLNKQSCTMFMSRKLNIVIF